MGNSGSSWRTGATAPSPNSARCSDTSGAPSASSTRSALEGMYGHSNQPAHHIAYVYDAAGRPWKTQEKVREVLSRLYLGSEIGQGYPGDEDNGEMSA